MKRTIFLKVSNKTMKMDVKTKRDFKAIETGSGYSPKKYYPTLCIKLNLDIPDELFIKADKELTLKIERAKINSEIKVKEELTQKLKELKTKK